MLVGIVKIRRQTKRAGIDPTLSVVVAEGVALQMCNQPAGDIGEDYTNYEGDTLVQLFFGLIKFMFSQRIYHLPFGNKIAPVCTYYTSL